MKPSDLELMLFHDGELDRERQQVVRLARLRELSVSTRLAGLEELGELVRDAVRDRGYDAAHLRNDVARGRAVRRGSGALMLAAAAAALFGVAEPPLEPARGPTVEIEAVDFGSRTGAVFMLEGEGERQTAVVWLADDAEQAKLGTL